MTRGYTDDENAEIAQIIKGLRTRRGLTQQELCVQSGLSPYTVNKLETSTSHVRPATMKLIIEALGRFERVPKSTAERIAEIYRFSVGVIDSSALSEGPGFDAVNPSTTKDLHLLLDRAINAVGEMPSVAQSASIRAIEAVLSALASESTPRSSTLAKRHPPVRVGDHEVEVVEPVDPDADKANRRKHG